jgi:hypothetical protein
MALPKLGDWGEPSIPEEKLERQPKKEMQKKQTKMGCGFPVIHRYFAA